MNYFYIIKLLLLLYSIYLIVSYKSSFTSLRKYLVSETYFNKKEIKYFKNFQKNLKFSGYIKQSEVKVLIFLKYLAPILFFILIFVMNYPRIKFSVISILIYIVVFNIFLRLKVSERNRIIEFNGYKIFKFLLNQISSGILVTDAIKSMYMIVNDSKLKSCLIDVSAYYIQTTDIIKSLDILKEQYRGIEVDTLCIAIQQGVFTGKNCETMNRMEALLFKKYIYHIKRETDAKRHKSFLAVLILCLIIILMISIPIIIDILNAFNQIFI